MVNGLIRHEAKWTAPSLLWNSDPLAAMSTRNGSPWQPAILRFDNDLFMEETLSLLAYQPEQLAERIAKPETWTKPMARPATISRAETLEPISEFSKKIRRQGALGAPTKDVAKIGNTAVSGIDGVVVDELPFKLYQPAHQRFYLVAASLVCQQVGMPDRRIDSGKREAVSFVIRRVDYSGSNDVAKKVYDATDKDWSEYAFVATAEGFSWKSISPAERTQVQSGEERLPLFAMHFNERERFQRRMLAGLIPVGKREAYLSAPRLPEMQEEDRGSQSAQKMAGATLTALYDAQIAAPWSAIVEQASLVQKTLLSEKNPAPTDDTGWQKRAENAKNVIQSSRERIQTASWYILLDFALFLSKYLEYVWKELKSESKDRALTDQEKTLANTIREMKISSPLISALQNGNYQADDIKTYLYSALIAVHDKQRDLELVDKPYDREDKVIALEDKWPDFLFPLADSGVEVIEAFLQTPAKVQLNANIKGPIPNLDVEEANLENWEEAILKINALTDLVQKALLSLPAMKNEPLPEIQVPQQPLNPGDGWFVIRCVYERPDCGPMNPAVLSPPTEKFLMAPFFDPDAPARPVRISLPMDISPAGLRKYKKNATLMMSDMLCGKVGEIRKLTFGDIVLSVLPWPFHKDLPNPGKTGPCKKGEENAGMYCSLSIPIVTLVALILMIIIVSLFDMFFRWIPYLFTCFPIPGLKGKKA